MTIRYIERKTSAIEEEKIYGHRALSLLYGDSWGSRLFSWFFSPLLSRVAFFSRLYGFFQKISWSAKRVDPFIKTYAIDRSEFVQEKFSSFNDFFVRKLKKEVRPIVADRDRAATPSDGRYLVFPHLDQVKTFYVKGQPFDLSSFLQDEDLVSRYREGSMMIVRLCPTDYHRFHFLDRGIPSISREMKGQYHSVNPMALRKNLSIFWKNKRMISDFDTENFGKVVYVEVGAICVGTIHQTYIPNQMVEKGEEKGYFSFGGSCLVILFEKGRISFDEDLILASKRGFEVKANFGESLGRRV